MRWLIVAVFSLSFWVSPRRACADDLHDFIMSCSYGVLAGTLVGVASLAFEDQPGKNLNHVARGASIGLYAGILLGLYAIYLVPEEGEGDIARVSLAPTLNPAQQMDGAQAQMSIWRW